MGRFSVCPSVCSSVRPSIPPSEPSSQAWGPASHAWSLRLGWLAGWASDLAGWASDQSWLAQTNGPTDGRTIPKRFLNPIYPNIFTFWSIPNKMYAIGFPSRASKKQLTSHSSILPYSKAPSAPFKDLFAPFTQYSTKILPVSSRSCGILQTPSRSSGRANPVYFYVKMHPTPHLKNYVHFLVNPEQEFIIKMSVIVFPSKASKK